MIRINDLGDPFTTPPDTGAPPKWPRPRTFQKLPPSSLFDPGEPGEEQPETTPPEPEAFRGGQAVICPPGYTRNPVPPHDCLSDVESGGELERFREEVRREGYYVPPLRVPPPVRSWTEGEIEEQGARDIQEFRARWPDPGPTPGAHPSGELLDTPTPGGSSPTPQGLTPTPTPGGGGGGLMPTPGGFSVPGGLTPTATPGGGSSMPSGGGMPAPAPGGGGMPGGGAPPAPPALIDVPTLGVPIRVATPMTMSGFLGQVPVRCVGF